MSTIAAADPTSDLFFYTLHGNVPGILSALDAGAEVDAIVSDMQSPFLALRKSLTEEMQKQTWRSGFGKVLSKYHRARTPLLLAAEFDRYNAVVALLDHGADPNFADEDSMTPLWAAAHRGQANIVRILLRAGADVHAEDCEGQTPLFRAVAKGDLKSVRILLAAGAEANKVTPYGITPLLLAARRGRKIDIAKTEYRPELVSDRYEEMLASIDDLDRFAPVSVGVESWRNRKEPPAGHYPAIVAELLAQGADATQIFHTGFQSNQGTTALHEAALLGCEETVRLLLDHGAELNAETAMGMTPLSNAAMSRNGNLVQLLLDKGATGINARMDRFTPLMSAVVFGQPETVSVLLENGADFTLKRTTGEDVMHRAAESNNPEAIRLLVAKGADVDSRDRRQRTPLMIAAKSRSIKAVHSLLVSGAGIHAVDEDGKTAWNMGLLSSLIYWMQGGRNNKRRRGNFIYFAMALWINGYRDDLEK